MSADGLRLVGSAVPRRSRNGHVATERRPPSDHPMMAQFHVAGWGTALPERRVTNDELAQGLDTSDEWIQTRTGIRERRVSGPGESTGALALAAAHQALDRAGLTPDQLDLIVVATATPEQPVPATGAGLASALGISAGAFDVNAGCAGFVYGVVVASGLLQAGAGRRILLVGADTMTRFTDPVDRATFVLFGDGAGAVVLDATEHASAAGSPSPGPRLPVADDDLPGGLLASDLVGDPDAYDLLGVPAGGSARPASLDTVRARQHYLKMDGREVFRRAVRGVQESILRTLEKAGCDPAEVDLFIPHQANARIIDAVLERVGIAPERTLQTVERHGNTSAASVPLALGEIAGTGQLPEGSLVLTSGFGAGLTVGTCLLRWRTSGAAMGSSR
jgi:3-oxoacyl-[acyl-carrier-protein] synthase III